MSVSREQIEQEVRAEIMQSFAEPKHENNSITPKWSPLHAL